MAPRLTEPARRRGFVVAMKKLHNPMHRWPAALLALGTVACAGMAVTTTVPSGEPYRALGTEPFWSVTIDGGRMTYDPMEGPEVSVPLPAPAPLGNDGRRYATDRLTMEIVPGQCSDGMSDRLYADTVRVTADGRALNGCGGAIVAPETLADTNWTIRAIDGDTVEGGDLYFLQFSVDRLSGRAGCNQFSGPFTLSGDTLTPGPVVATRMACPKPRMGHERAMMALLDGPVTLAYLNGDGLILTRQGHRIALGRAH